MFFKAKSAAQRAQKNIPIVFIPPPQKKKNPFSKQEQIESSGIWTIYCFIIEFSRIFKTQLLQMRVLWCITYSKIKTGLHAERSHLSPVRTHSDTPKKPVPVSVHVASKYHPSCFYRCNFRCIYIILPVFQKVHKDYS